MKLTVLCGGVGGSKFVLGLREEFPDADISVVVNTGDDLTLFGLHLSPDLDTVIYTLAGLANPTTGWGLQDETFHALEALGNLGAGTWFKLGDRDLATHLFRTQLRAEGFTLTDATAEIARKFGICQRILPMSDQRIRTRIRVADGWIDFQDYFVRRERADVPLEVAYDGVDEACLTAEVREAMSSADLIIAAPSNPVVSIGPMLRIPGMLNCLIHSAAPKIAVSPFIGTQSVTGPADALMRAIGHEPSSAGLALFYGSWLDVLLMSEADKPMVPAIAAEGVRVVTANTIMTDLAAKRRLARVAVGAAE